MREMHKLSPSATKWHKLNRLTVTLRIRKHGLRNFIQITFTILSMSQTKASLTSEFESRHIGPRGEETREMLEQIGVPDIETLISQTIPAAIRVKQDPEIPAPMTEFEYLQMMKQIARLAEA